MFVIIFITQFSSPSTIFEVAKDKLQHLYSLVSFLLRLWLEVYSVSFIICFSIYLEHYALNTFILQVYWYTLCCSCEH